MSVRLPIAGLHIIHILNPSYIAYLLYIVLHTTDSDRFFGREHPDFTGSAREIRVVSRGGYDPARPLRTACAWRNTARSLTPAPERRTWSEETHVALGGPFVGGGMDDLVESSEH